MKTKRNLILVSGILFIVSAISLLIVTILVGVLFDNTFMEIIVQELDQLILIGELTTERYDYIINIIESIVLLFMIFSSIACIIDFVIGGLLLKRSKASNEVIENNKGLIICGIIAAFFCGGFIAGILLIVSIALKSKEDNLVLNEASASNSANTPSNTDVQQPTSVTLNGEYEGKIKKLQALRDSGAISKDEYDLLLKQIFKD